MMIYKNNLLDDHFHLQFLTIPSCKTSSSFVLSLIMIKSYDNISASGHVIAVISKDVTATQAELILTKLTHNATGARIGNNVTISSTAIYLLHLPNDILSTIPTFVKNAGMGEGPNYLNPLGIISDIAGMAFDFLVWVASGGLLLLFVHLVEMGLEAIGNLLAAAAAAVQDAVDAIVDAFNAFIDWVIDLMVNYLETLFFPLIENI